MPITNCWHRTCLFTGWNVTLRACAKGSFSLRQHGTLRFYVCYFSPHRVKNNIYTGTSEGGVRPNFCRRDHLGEATEEFDQARERYVQGRTRAARRAESTAGRRSVG